MTADEATEDIVKNQIPALKVYSHTWPTSASLPLARWG
jgi:hypothetical protein